MHGDAEVRESCLQPRSLLRAPARCYLFEFHG